MLHTENQVLINKEYKFISIFNPNGFVIDGTKVIYARSGVFKNGIETQEDPFMTSFPELIDVGIMGHCSHAQFCSVDCYQSAKNIHVPNMTLDNFKKIVDECTGKTFQFALGGRGDVNKHENFKEIVKYCNENKIVPNFTTSGFNLTQDEIDIAKTYCGAVAVSWYKKPYTIDAITNLINAGIKTNIHFVLGNHTVDDAIELLNNYPTGINAIIFLLYKPVGHGKIENILTINEKSKLFFTTIDDIVAKDEQKIKIGFDSCSVPALINHTQNISEVAMDTCEGSRWSMYITPDMKALPCSFDQKYNYAFDISKNTIKEAWDSQQFEKFRNVFRGACPSCEKKLSCFGGCPITPEITLCQNK